ncbi:phosphate/phosphite/phosphonate ABC transporter substrate-binding protein [Sulfuriferula sp. GW1]|uniref:phosphate/phosphite/phosphonate ABC transporter substrate-binding protein n=1 Tax=Sulfuriferula sp. GW1 TaxID=3345111 RepID=UPI0039AF4EAC
MFKAKLLLTLSLILMSLQANAQDITIGTVAMDAPVEMIKRMTPLAEYLAQQTGYRMQFRPAPNLDSAVADLGSGKVQIAYMTPIAYIMAHEKHQAIPLVTPLTHGKSTFNLVVVVPKDSPVKKLDDLKGKRFAFGDPKAFLQPAVLLEAGMNIQDFSAVAYLKHYDNIAKAILLGDFDGGIMKDTVYEKFAPQGLRVVYTSPPLASYVFAVSGALDAATQNKLKAAFMALNRPTAEAQSILRTLDQGYDGFQPASDKNYDGERDLIARVKKKRPNECARQLIHCTHS